MIVYYDICQKIKSWLCLCAARLYLIVFALRLFRGRERERQNHEKLFFDLFSTDKDESPTQIRHLYVLEIDRMRVNQLKWNMKWIRTQIEAFYSSRDKSHVHHFSHIPILLNESNEKFVSKTAIASPRIFSYSRSKSLIGELHDYGIMKIIIVLMIDRRLIR